MSRKIRKKEHMINVRFCPHVFVISGNYVKRKTKSDQTAIITACRGSRPRYLRGVHGADFLVPHLDAPWMLQPEGLSWDLPCRLRFNRPHRRTKPPPSPTPIPFAKFAPKPPPPPSGYIINRTWGTLYRLGTLIDRVLAWAYKPFLRVLARRWLRLHSR